MLKTEKKRADKERTYAVFVNQVLRDSVNGPISFDAIVRQVGLLRGADLPTSVTEVRDALESPLTVEIVGEGYCWYPNMINGSRVRVSLITHDGEFESLVFDEEAREMLWPPPFDNGSLRNLGPVDVRLPGGEQTSFRLKIFNGRAWGTTISPAFRRWLKRSKAVSGDGLIIEAADVQARCYNVTHEPRRTRDVKTIRKRTAEIENVVLAAGWLIRNDDLDLDVWELTKRLLIAGYYKDPVPPKPISRIWSRLRPDWEEPEGYETADSEIVASTFTPRPMWEDSDGYYDKALTRRRNIEMKKPHAVFQLKILLSESDPQIWRRVLVTDATTLNDLHQVIQHSTGWTDSHLHQFVIDGECYSDPAFELSESISNMHDEYGVTLREIANRKPQQFFYEYDFGDRWFHEIVIENSSRLNRDGLYPKCVSGERACPPEDCRGIRGYDEFLKAIEDPDHPDHETCLEWIGGYFDPEYLNLGPVNINLLNTTYIMDKMIDPDR